MMRKWGFAVLLAIALCIGCLKLLPTQVQAAAVDSGTCGDNLTWVLDDAGVLTISGTGPMYDYGATNFPWRAHSVDCLMLVVEDGVTRIGEFAFYGCNIRTVVLPESVTEIRPAAFSDCGSLESISLPSGIMSLPAATFFQCSSLTHVDLPANLEYIGPDVFGSCISLETITIPTWVSIIGNGAFAGCDNLKTMEYLGTLEQWQAINFDYGNEKLLAAYEYSYCRHANWSEEWIEKDATCKEEGRIAFVCGDCGVSGTQIIEKLTIHKYTDWTKLDNDFHKRICPVCDREETAVHSWNSGVITKAATCKEFGIKTFTCTDCGTAKTESIAKSRIHTYDNACDAFCNVCDSSRTVTHQYGNKWSKDASGHWYTCTICSSKGDQAAHTPGAVATETSAQTCTKCSYVIQAPLGHTHYYESSWSKDTSIHWHACTCGAQKDSAAHSWDVGKVTKVATCKEGGTKTYTCTVCKEIKTETIDKLNTHTPGMDATATNPQTCSVCNAVLTPATGITPPISTEPPATEPPVTEPPVTETPATEPPVTETPVTETPVTETPVTETPVTEPPVTETPVTETPVTEPVASLTIPETTEPTIAPTQQEETVKPTKVGFPIVIIIVIVILSGCGVSLGVILWKKKN